VPRRCLGGSAGRGVLSRASCWFELAFVLVTVTEEAAVLWLSKLQEAQAEWAAREDEFDTRRSNGRHMIDAHCEGLGLGPEPNSASRPRAWKPSLRSVKVVASPRNQISLLDQRARGPNS
jgi:hypothetical protein